MCKSAFRLALVWLIPICLFPVRHIPFWVLQVCRLNCICNRLTRTVWFKRISMLTFSTESCFLSSLSCFPWGRYIVGIYSLFLWHTYSSTPDHPFYAAWHIRPIESVCRPLCPEPFLPRSPTKYQLRSTHLEMSFLVLSLAAPSFFFFPRNPGHQRPCVRKGIRSSSVLKSSCFCDSNH